MKVLFLGCLLAVTLLAGPALAQSCKPLPKGKNHLKTFVCGMHVITGEVLAVLKSHWSSPTLLLVL